MITRLVIATPVLYQHSVESVNNLSILSTACIVTIVATASESANPTPSNAPKARGRRAARASGDDRERAILETAERLLEERSLSEISVDDLAKGAGISRPTFYFYFPSRDAVVLTIIERMIPAVTVAGRDRALAMLTEDPRAGLKQRLEEVYATFKKRKAVVLAAVELRTTNEEAERLWATIMESWVSDVTTIIEGERARGAAPEGTPARDLAIALVQMNERVQHGTLVSESPSLGEDRAIDVLIDIWLLTIYGTTQP
jgi:TetR/AcrR family transcriptional regulator, ethionamide resistance regulator